MMRVVAVEICGTIPWKNEVSIALPERGVVLLSGPNGAGKSSVIDAVALGLYRRTLRRRSDSTDDAQPWREGAAAQLCVRLARDRAVVLSRSARGKVSHDIGDGVSYETADAARDAISREFYDFEQWRRTCVLTGASAGYFSAAGEAERRAFIEGLLGLDKADVLAERLAKTEKARQSLFDAAEKRKFAAATEIDVLARALEDAKSPPLEDGPQFVGRYADEAGAIYAAGGEGALSLWLVNALDRLAEQESDCLANEAVAHKAERAQSTELSCNAEIMRVARASSVCLEAGECDKCGQHVSSEYAAARAADAANRLTEADAAYRKSRSAYDERVAELRAAREKTAAVREARGELNQNIAQVASAYWKARDAFQARTVSKCELALFSAKIFLSAVTAECDEAARKLDIVRKARSVLTTARARVLSSSLTEVANGYLSRLGADYSARVSAVSRTASGDVRERISIDVDGAGNGYGYGGCSSGQRKRIDVALLLGLAELARASLGIDGVLWLDELFGHLDADGREAAAGLVREIAAERCVVVVEHDAAMEEALRPSKIYRFADGEVTS